MTTLEQHLKTEPPPAKLCALCKAKLSGADPHPSVVIDGIGEICAECESVAISTAIGQHPVGKLMQTIGH